MWDDCLSVYPSPSRVLHITVAHLLKAIVAAVNP